jgi:glycerol-3-phosphate dehydrogenase
MDRLPVAFPLVGAGTLGRRVVFPDGGSGTCLAANEPCYQGNGMKRDPTALEDRCFDLAIVGGGIFGACAAADAAARGLRVALLERDDFGSRTSASSFQVLDGGMRYLQHRDLPRLRQASGERRALLRVAPHLVEPREVVVPTMPGPGRGALGLRAGGLVHDLLTLDRNRGVRDPGRRVPGCRTLGARAVREMFPELEALAPTGAWVFADGQIYNPPRLVWGFVESALRAGAAAVNHVEVTTFLRRGDRVVGVRAVDLLSGGEVEVRARCVLNASGPYAEALVQQALGLRLRHPRSYSRDACFVVDRRFGDGVHGLAVLGGARDPAVLAGRGARHLFLMPWRDLTLVGVWHRVYGGDPERAELSVSDLEELLAEINGALPGVALRLDEVTDWHVALVPRGENERGAPSLRHRHGSSLVDHQAEHRLEGLVSLVGVRLTTARIDAARAVDLVQRKLGWARTSSTTSRRPLPAGDLDSVSALLREAERQRPPAVSEASARQLARNHGRRALEMLQIAARRPSLGSRLGGSDVLAIQVVEAIDREMAQTLADVALRRTELATGRFPGVDALSSAALWMSAALGWSAERERREIAAVVDHFAWLPRHRRALAAHHTRAEPDRRLRREASNG